MAARKRTERRALARTSQKLARDLARLATLERGGAPSRPIDVASPSVVDVHAASLPCPICEGKVRVLEHTAKTIDDVRLRVVDVACTACGAKRALYFRIVPPLAS